MEKLLLIGIDTRSMLNSALKLDYEIFSTSYFSSSDTPQIKNQKIILNEQENQSCGIFEDQFNSANILEISKDYLDDVDYIIPISGISPSDFSNKHKKKILGTKDVENIEDKYRFYKKIKDEFLTPKSFNVTDIDEAFEISENYEDIQFILKPLQGSGGYDINLIDNEKELQFNDGEFILQEYIPGISLSSSLLASKNDAKTIINTRLLTQHDFEKNNSFIYVGNILPLTNESVMADVRDIDEINSEMEIASEKLAQKFNLIGSNGVDYILNENGLYVIEINPRIQGTFECVEKSLGINMLDAHIKACQGEIIEIPKPKYYSYKKIIYSPNRNKFEKIDLNNIYDLPHIGSITEKSEPLLTIIDKDSDFEKLYEKVELTTQKVQKAARKSQLGVK
ncbi:MAG: ATP-grasp domain-containing protein [Methanobrevibacter sp.]|uniref:ATP-grasp domain-containing protein n=1 Tax=Methanobrevibacter sp. TaxID=66852 RepID=UPI0025F2A3FE|nr:ATP-grasp domain-containing protein [Methanobrevibacter sp.]MBQ6098250.1 ATP-grasp domain-containing protein [Methanobrevibacter sp.]